MEDVQNFKWNQIKATCKTFQLEDEPELIHVIKTGFEDKYMVVYEDAYEFNLGKVIFGTKAEIESQFKITL